MSEKKYFPMFIDIHNYHILVVGGGRIALRRIRTLLQFCSDISVLATDICEEIAEMEVEEKLIISRKSYEPEDLKVKTYAQNQINRQKEYFDMVLAATNNKEVNHSIWKECKKRNILVNVADNQKLCDFYFPSVVMNDDVVIGINSGGKNPSVVKTIRQKIEKLLEKTRKIYE